MKFWNNSLGEGLGKGSCDYQRYIVFTKNKIGQINLIAVSERINTVEIKRNVALKFLERFNRVK